MFSSPFVKRNLSLSWPLALNALLMQSMLMIETLLVSPLGEIPLAAMGIATTIVAFVLGIQMALANGTQLVISRAVGSGKAASLSKAFWAGMLINLAIGLLFWLLLSLFEQPLIDLLTDNQALDQQISDYLLISKNIIVFNAITQVIISLFNGLGRTKIPFKGYLLEMPLNAGLSFVLIHGLASFEGMGVEGAALGSLIAIFVRFIYLSLALRVEQNLQLSLKQHNQGLFTHSKAHFVEIFPVATNVTILSIGVTVYQLLYSQLALNSYVAIAVLMPWIKAGTQFITAWAHASAITVSRAIGSGKLEELDEDVNTSIRTAVLISVASAVFFFALSFALPSIYPDLDESTYQALAVIAPLYILLPIVRGYNTVHGHVLRALGKTTSVFKVNFTGQWIISIPLCALLVLYFDASIFWAFAIQPFEELIKALPFRYVARKTLREFDQAKAERLAI